MNWSRTSNLLLSLLYTTLMLVAVGEAKGDRLDQFQTLNGGALTIAANGKHAQTFRPSHSGLLTGIEIHSHSNNAVDFLSIVEISIVETVNMVPSGATLGTVYLDWPKTLGWLFFDYSDQEVRLQAEQEYAIVLTADRPKPVGVTYGDEVTIMWHDNPYPRGQLWRALGSGPWQRYNAFGPAGEADMAFKTYLIIPEPSTSIVLCAFGLLFAARRS
jgi:hypothetical protein